MSVLIKGAKPPSGCTFCYFNVDSKCALIPGCNYDETNGWQRRDDCPLIELPESSFIPAMPITNADRIRQMSDDELATLFGDACACHYDDADVCEKWGGACDRCWLDWLKQEVDDDRT